MVWSSAPRNIASMMPITTERTSACVSGLLSAGFAGAGFAGAALPARVLRISAWGRAVWDSCEGLAHSFIAPAPLRKQGGTHKAAMLVRAFALPCCVSRMQCSVQRCAALRPGHGMLHFRIMMRPLLLAVLAALLAGAAVTASRAQVPCAECLSIRIGAAADRARALGRGIRRALCGDQARRRRLSRLHLQPPHLCRRRRLARRHGRAKARDHAARPQGHAVGLRQLADRRAAARRQADRPRAWRERLRLRQGPHPQGDGDRHLRRRRADTGLSSDPSSPTPTRPRPAR